MNTSKVIDKKLRGGAESAPPPVGIGLRWISTYYDGNRMEW